MERQTETDRDLANYKRVSFAPQKSGVWPKVFDGVVQADFSPVITSGFSGLGMEYSNMKRMLSGWKDNVYKSQKSFLET